MNTEIVTIDSLSPSGHGISNNGWYVLGAFPGDIIKARSYKIAEGITYGEIQKIITSSSFRSYAPELLPFFNANAPWEYLKQEYENKIKKEIVTSLFKKIADRDIHPTATLIDAPTTHYRNKAAYSFMMQKGKLEFALFTRGVSGQEKVVQQDNILVHHEINRLSERFLNFFNQKKIPLADLKYLILRYSYSTNSIVAQILATETNRKKLPWKKEELLTFMNRHPALVGILVSHSEPGIRSSICTKDFYELGHITIQEELAGKKYQYHPSQFFQIYPHAFSTILIDLDKEISKIQNHQEFELLDLFAGVGVIGLHLSQLVHRVHGVEYSPLAREYATTNAHINNISEFTFTEANVNQALEYIKPEQILIVDPPRSGLSSETLAVLLKVQPRYIFYISCSPESQARDYKKLQKDYDVRQSYVYNIFPKTPHIEHLICLERKNTP